MTFQVQQVESLNVFWFSVLSFHTSGRPHSTALRDDNSGLSESDTEKEGMQALREHVIIHPCSRRAVFHNASLTLGMFLVMFFVCQLDEKNPRALKEAQKNKAY
jgi:hypothetical protein